MHTDREHVISVVLTHDDWKKFMALQPQPVNWLRERIQEMLASARSEDSSDDARPQMA